MNFCQLWKEHSGLCDWRNWQKGALRNQPKRKHFLLNVPYPVIYRTPLPIRRWRIASPLFVLRAIKPWSNSPRQLFRHLGPETRNGASPTKNSRKESWRQHALYVNKRGNKKLCKLYTIPTLCSLSSWFSARYKMYSLCSKPYTKRRVNPTLQRHAVLLRSAPK